MSKVVLFSPVGGTDPISEKNYFDGSMLHICRHYKPDIVYLYLSKEILNKHRDDNRYRKFIERLAKEKLNKTIEIIPIEKTELVDVSDYKLVYNFLLNDIQQVTDILEEGDTLLVNVSSGTPAIKNNLQLLDAIDKFDKPQFKNVQIKLIQVKTPENKMNTHIHTEKYDENGFELMWSLNDDAEGNANYANRCFEDDFIITKVLQEEIIKSLIRAYDYPAAYKIAKRMKTTSEPYIQYIEGAVNRNKLDYNKAKNIFKDATNIKEIFPIQEGDKIGLFEYIQNVEIKCKRGEFADFIRSTSPVIFSLFQLILKKDNIDIKNLSTNVRGKLYWEESLLKEDECIYSILSNSPFDFRPDSYIKSDHLYRIIEKKCSNKDILELAKTIRKIEIDVRNKAAHEIIKIDEKYIKDVTDKTSTQICDILKQLFQYVSCNNLKKDSWNSYDRMNDYIIDKIK